MAAKPGGQEGAVGEAEGLAEGGGDAIGLVELVSTLKGMIEVSSKHSHGEFSTTIIELRA